ncbi:type II CAAX prenyl endopeptidase Rce1 family protein [Clostridium sp.]|uniref:CPBP family glutamic-type intramembrane protease n=1 Tax=Clostridium sp. TaxID=1506 RepID=UPI0037C1833E
MSSIIILTEHTFKVNTFGKIFIFIISNYVTYSLKSALLPLLLSYLLGKLYTCSKSLTPSIIFHGLYNFF